MSGTALNQFNDFVEATGPTYVTGPQDLVNDAQKNTYSFGLLMGGDTGKKKMVQGGSDIRESIVFQDNGTFKFTLPGETQNWVNPQKLTKIKADWRFSLTHMSWTRQEVLLNDRIKYGTSEAKFHAYVDLRNEKETLMWTSKWNGMETQAWVKPDADQMEAAGGKQPYSIPAFINEQTNGLFLPRVSGETDWTTVEGIDPTVTTIGQNAFVPQQRTYSTEIANLTNIFSSGNIISTFDMMWKDVRYEMPPTMTEYFENPKYNRQRIFCSAAGQSAYQQALRVSQDQFVVAGRQDPNYASPAYNGIPVTWVSELDTAALYDDPTTLLTVAEGTADLIGPRYYWVNSQYLFPVFHDQMYFEKDEVSRHHNDPDTFVCPVATWYQFICTSRQRQGIVSPSGDLYTSLY